MSHPIFDTWQGQPLSEVLMLCRDLTEDPDYPTVQRWRANGGKVLGHFQVYFPEEIAHAAGMLPVKLRGSTLAPDQSDSRFGSYLCSILKTSLELSLGGKLELDMFVSHPICDAARNLAAIWGRNHSYPCEILYLPQNPNSAASIGYLRNEYARMMRTVEGVVGHAISEESLRASIVVFNENRRLLRELYRIKRETPWKIAAEDAYSLVAMAGMIPREEHNDLMKYVLPLIEASDNKKDDRLRVVFEGGFCEQPPLDLVRLIGRSAYLVDDDLLIGLRYILSDIPVAEDPLQDLAHAYIEQSTYSPVQHDLRKPKEKMLVARYRAAQGEAVIVAAAKMCEPGLEEQVAYIHELEALGIPHFVSEFEERMTSFSDLELQLETFMENILFA